MTLAVPPRLSDAMRREALARIGIDVWVRRGPRHGPAAGAAPRAVFLLGGEPGAAAVAWQGPHGTLLAQLARALGLSPDQIAFAPLPGLPVIGFGTAPDAHAGAVLAPALPDLAASGAAKRALWPALRRLRRALGTG